MVGERFEMKIRVLILSIFTIIVLAGCTSAPEPPQEKIWLEAGVENNFKNELRNMTFMFALILKEAAQANTSNDIHYLRGKIDGFLMLQAMM